MPCNYSVLDVCGSEVYHKFSVNLQTRRSELYHNSVYGNLANNIK